MQAPENITPPDASPIPTDGITLDQALAVLRHALNQAEQQTSPGAAATGQEILQAMLAVPAPPLTVAPPPRSAAKVAAPPVPTRTVAPPAPTRMFLPTQAPAVAQAAAARPSPQVTIGLAPAAKPARGVAAPVMAAPSPVASPVAHHPPAAAHGPPFVPAMDPAAVGEDHGPYEPVVFAAQKVSFWRKLGGGSLAISVMFHVILLVLGAYWVLRVINPPEKKVDFMPAGDGGGGGERGLKYDVQRKKIAAMTPVTNPKRVFAEGSATALQLPPPEDSFGEMTPLTSLSNGGMSGGMGGAGSGGGMGGGDGKGIGNGKGAGMGGGAARGANLFGLIDPSENSLMGCIYDLHQGKDGKPNKNPQQPANMDGLVWVRPIVTSFIENGWREEKLDNYYKGPATLGIQQMLIPQSLATAAPDAFQATGKMNGGGWIAVYRGRVTAPETAEIRFLGSADNFIVLRWGKKNILAFDCGNQPSATQNIGLRMPMAVGEWITVNKGATYDVAILIGDAGGLFSACLYYEKKDEPGKRYLFRTEITDFAPVLAKDVGDMPKNFEVNSPAWPCKRPRVTF